MQSAKKKPYLVRAATPTDNIALFVFLAANIVVQVRGGLVCESSGWDVTPSEAYTWGYRPPQGCTCQATGVSLSECEIFDCQCVCDLTAGHCDANCCCDAECTETEVERFAELGACLDEGPAEEVTTMCYSTDVLDAVNPRYPLTGGGAAEAALDGLLCVQYDNSGTKGEFFEDPGTLPITIFSDSGGGSEFLYHDLLAASPGVVATEGDAFFDTGDRIPAAFVSNSGGSVAAFGGYFPLPVADDRGRCNEANFAGFGTPIPAVTGDANICAREVENLQDECSLAFGWARFSENLHAGTRGTVTPDAVFSGNDYVLVEIASTTWRDWNTGDESDFTDVNCGAFYYDGADATMLYPACVLGGRGNETVAANTNATAGCKNALASVCYTITHDGEGRVVAVTAAIVLTDVPPGPDGANSSAVSPQEFSVEYRLDETAEASSTVTRSQDLGNLVERARSGNPGYLLGLPVLAGRLEYSGDDEYMAAGRSEGGGELELMAGGGRGCNDAGTSTVDFGYDGIGCCVLSLTRDALAEHCEGTGAYVDSDTGFTPLAFRNTSSSATHLGGYGNADPLDVSQWLELVFSASTDTASWDDDSGVCSSLVSTLEYRILYTSVGSTSNPQNKIISAEARYGKSDWVWREEASDEQNFIVCNSASFKMYDQEAQRYTPPSPPVAFTVPWDVFYPFYISTSGGTMAASLPPSRWAITGFALLSSVVLSVRVSLSACL